MIKFLKYRPIQLSALSKPFPSSSSILVEPIIDVGTFVCFIWLLWNWSLVCFFCFLKVILSVVLEASCWSYDWHFYLIKVVMLVVSGASSNCSLVCFYCFLKVILSLVLDCSRWFYYWHCSFNCFNWSLVCFYCFIGSMVDILLCRLFLRYKRLFFDAAANWDCKQERQERNEHKKQDWRDMSMIAELLVLSRAKLVILSFKPGPHTCNALIALEPVWTKGGLTTIARHWVFHVGVPVWADRHKIKSPFWALLDNY